MTRATPPTSLRSWRARRRSRALVARALPDTVELTIIAIRAGLAPGAALVEAGRHASPPIAAAIAEFEHRLHRGQAVADAITALPEQLGAGADALADGLATADRYGLPLEPVLERLADAVRADRRRVAEQQARTLPVRLSFPLVVCTLPSFVLLAIVPALLGALSTLHGTAP